MSARTFAVFIGVLALIGLLAFGLVSKGEGALAVGDDGARDRAAGARREAAPARSPTTRASGCWSTSGPRGAGRVATRRRRSRPSTASTAARTSRCSGSTPRRPAEGGRGFVDEFELTYPQLHDGDGAYADELKTTGVPENFLVDPDGKLAVAQPGPVDETLLDEQVAPLIEGG